ncbi:ATP-binding protein [Microvirga ossetica]|uniref:ATP-binding protein n=1 Tax=Microvirga ossetica TaxID=1882682 RepID=UPI001F4801F6|nr:AAA family ATPase [Microvirga ossetica]
MGLGQYEQAFRDNDIDASLLPTLTDGDLRELGILSLGHRKRLLAAIPELTKPDEEKPKVVLDRTPQAERRQLTVMFVDLVGSTALSSRLDPEDMRKVLHAYQNAVTGEIARLGGNLAKLMGDGVLAYFGWPSADEDDPERAVQAGLTIVQAVGRLSTPFGEPIAARVGIATGLVIVGDLIGEGAAREEAVVGETPNLAARLQEAAPAGAVVIAAGTRRLLGDTFDLRDLGPVYLKGFDRPVNSFEVLRPRLAESRFEARHPDRSLPMFGRDQELALVLERWRQSVAGEGQAVLVVGEAGIGKSRLVQALLDETAEDPHIVLRYQCSPQYTGTPLWPVVQQLGFAAGFVPEDGDEQKWQKTEALLRRGTDDVSEAAPLIASLLGIEAESPYPFQELSSQQRRARTQAALIQQLLGLERRHPVLIVIEDVHWIDPTTLELFSQVLDRIANARVLMVLTSRPDNQPNLGGHPHVTRLTLNRLGRGSTEAIVSRLSGSQSLPPAVLREIAARTDGVPLFIEELTKAVLEAGMTAPGAVPVSLYASLLARLDRVTGVREVAQVAACVGREFSYSLVAAVSPVSEADLQSALDRLTAAELIFRRGTPPETHYAFKHALVRDAAHESLLKDRRQQLHASIAQALEEHFPESWDMEPELLARHYTEAGLTEQAVEYWRRAGEQALARSAMAEAVTHLTEGLAVLRSLALGQERQQHELRLQLALGQASIAGKGFAAPETGRAYARARELCLELGDVPQLFPVLYGQSVFYFQRGELREAHEIACELLRLGRERLNAAAQMIGHRMVGSTLCQCGRFAESRDAFEAALALYDPVRDRGSGLVYAIDTRVMCLSWLSHLYLILGDPDQALALSRRVPAHVGELEHPGTAAVALAWGCIFDQLLRDPHNAETQAQAAIALGTEQGFPLYRAAGSVVHGWAQAEVGRVADGLAEMRQGLADYRATGAEMWSPYFLGLLADASRREDSAQEGLGLVEAALTQIRHTGGQWIEAELHRVRGELLLARSEPDQQEAELCFHRALALARGQNARLWELQVAMSLARLWSNQHRTQAAHDLLAPICSLFKDGFEISALRDAEILLDRLAPIPRDGADHLNP